MLPEQGFDKAVVTRERGLDRCASCSLVNGHDQIGAALKLTSEPPEKAPLEPLLQTRLYQQLVGAHPRCIPHDRRWHFYFHRV